VRERLRRVWTAIRHRRPVREWLGEDPGDGPFQEALVPVGPPRSPLLADGVALPLPEPEEWDTDAHGRAADGG